MLKKNIYTQIGLIFTACVIVTTSWAYTNQNNILKSNYIQLHGNSNQINMRNTMKWKSLGPIGGSASVVSVSNSNDQLIYIGTSHKLYKSSDGGNTWSILSDKLLFPKRIISVNSDVMYASTDIDLEKSSDGGKTWNVIYNGNWFSFEVVNEDEIILSSVDGIYKSHDSGESWELKLKPSYRDFLKLVKSKNNTIFAFYDTGLYKSSDNGNTWVDVNSSHDLDLKYGNFVIDDKNLLAYNMSGELFKSVNGGLTWKSIDYKNTELPVRITSIFAKSLYDIYLVTNKGIYKTKNGGDTWELTAENIANKKINFVYETITNRLFAGTNRGLFISDDNAKSWYLSEKVIDNAYVHDMVRTKNNIIFVKVGDYELLKSSDNGINWSNIEFDFGYIHALATDNSSDIAVLTRNGIYLSQDDGESWSNVHKNLNVTLSRGNVIFLNSSRIIYTLLDSKLFKTEDGGITWENVTPPTIEYYESKSVSTLGVYNDLVYAGRKDYFMISHDAGKTWKAHYVKDRIYSDSLESIHIVNESTAYAATNWNTLYKTIDGGETWTVVRYIEGYIISMASTLNSNVYISTSKGLYFSEDNGNNWLGYKSNLFKNIISMSTNNSSLLVATDNGVYSNE